MEKTGRNDPCPCGSGKKYKKCCELKSGLKKIEAKVLTSSQMSSSVEGASKLSRSFFQTVKQPVLKLHEEENQKKNEQ